MSSQEPNIPNEKSETPPPRPDDIKLQSDFVKKLDNYWYHYKWPTVIGLMIFIIVLVTTLQMCSKESYDCYMLYVSDEASPSATQWSNIEQSIEGCIDDYNKDGVKNVSIEHYYVDTHVSLDQWQYFNNALSAGDATVYLLSPEMFEKAAQEAEGELLIPLAELYADIEEDAYYRYSSGNVSYQGVYLHKIPFGTLPGLESLPEDTVLCIRHSTIVEGTFGWTAGAQENQRALVTAMLSYRAEEE